MQEKIVPQIDAAAWLDQDDIFYRPDDKAQFFNALDILTNERRGIAVSANNEMMLNHYCRLMVSRLRQAPLFNLEVLLPSTTDSLLKRFNKIIEKVSLDEALRPAKDTSPITLMIVNDAHLIEQQQWALLSQLISDFPGANVQLVVFINVSEWPQNDHAIDLFGHKLHRWTLGDLSITDVNNLFDMADSNGYTERVESLLKGLNQDLFIEHKERASVEIAPNVVDQDNTADLEFSELQAKETTSLKDSGELDVERNQVAPRWPKMVAVIMLMAASLLVTADINFQRGEEYINDALALFSYSEKPRAQTMSGSEILEKKSSAKMPKASASSVLSKPEIIIIPKIENLDNELSLPLIQQPENKQISEYSGGEQDTLVTVDVSSEVWTPIEIVENAQADSYFVQFNLFKEKLTAQTYRAQNEGLEDSMLMPLQTSEGAIYAIISGPFLSKEKATAFVSNPGMPKDYWIRPAKTLQSVIK